MLRSALLRPQSTPFNLPLLLSSLGTHCPQPSSERNQHAVRTESSKLYSCSVLIIVSRQISEQVSLVSTRYMYGVLCTVDVVAHPQQLPALPPPGSEVIVNKSVNPPPTPHPCGGGAKRGMEGVSHASDVPHPTLSTCCTCGGDRKRGREELVVMQMEGEGEGEKGGDRFEDAGCLATDSTGLVDWYGIRGESQGCGR